jgi:fluoroquinolone resistance protein
LQSAALFENMRARCAAFGPARGHKTSIVFQECSMNDAIIEATAPEGAVTRHHIEAVPRGHGSASIRFAGWNLTEADLNGLDFHGCEFVRCRVGHANLSSCNFTEARFLFCDFNNTKWRGTIVSSAFFQDCKLTGAQMAVANTLMSPAFERCLLINANLRGLSFRRGQLHGVDFQGADLRETDFRDAVLTGCSLREANVTNARFEGANLRGADLGSLQLADASRFKGAIISKKQAGELLSGLGLKVV